MKRTFQPKKRHRARVHGFRKRARATAVRYWLVVVKRAAKYYLHKIGHYLISGFFSKRGRGIHPLHYVRLCLSPFCIFKGWSEHAKVIPSKKGK